MRLTCPHCGERDRREFYYQGSAIALERPDREASPEVWDDYLHNRENPAGDTEELWQHTVCGTWIKVTRSTTTHIVSSSEVVAT